MHPTKKLGEYKRVYVGNNLYRVIGQKTGLYVNDSPMTLANADALLESLRYSKDEGCCVIR